MRIVRSCQFKLTVCGAQWSLVCWNADLWGGCGGADGNGRPVSGCSVGGGGNLPVHILLVSEKGDCGGSDNWIFLQLTVGLDLLGGYEGDL